MEPGPWQRPQMTQLTVPGQVRGGGRGKAVAEAAHDGGPYKVYTDNGGLTTVSQACWFNAGIQASVNSP